MESGQSTYQQVESFHWDKKEIIKKKHKKRESCDSLRNHQMGGMMIYL